LRGIYAGLLAWFIEVTVVVIFMLVLKYEENKVYKRRNNE